MAPPTKDGLLKGYASLCKILTFMLHMLALTALGPGLESDLIAELQLSRMCTSISGSQLFFFFPFSEGNALGKVSQLLLRICMWNDVLSKLGMTLTSSESASLQLHSVRADEELDLRREDQTETLLRCFDFWILSTYQKKFSFMIGWLTIQTVSCFLLQNVLLFLTRTNTKSKADDLSY